MSLMRTVRAGVLALVVTAVAVFAAPTPSLAAGDNYYEYCDAGWVSCQTGVKVSYPAGECDTVRAGYQYTQVCVDYYGDYVYVYDGLSDSYSAMARIESDYGDILTRFCRNPHGADSWARCNFDWREDGYKVVHGGYRASGSYYFGHYDWMWRFINN